MFPPDLDPVNYDDWTDESYMSACDLILKIIQIYSLISSLLQEIEN